MNYSTTQTAALAQLTSLRAKASARISSINWVKVRTYLYNAAVAFGVALYLVYIAGRAALSTAKNAKALWMKYEVSAKIQTAIAAIRSEVPPLAARIIEVKRAYNVFAGKTRGVVASAKADYQNIRSEFGVE